MFPEHVLGWDQPKAVSGDLKSVPLVIGIAGGTCAGKSRLAEGLAAHFANAALLAMDSFYRPQPPEAIAAGIADFDSPEALDLDAMAAALRSLRAGRAVEIPVYDRAASRAAGRRTVSPHPVLLVEGLFVLAWPAIREQLDLKVFITVDGPVQRARRQARDLELYHRSQARLRDDLARAAAAQERDVLPSRAFADLMLSGTDPLDQQVAACLKALC